MGILAKHKFKLTVHFEKEDGRFVPGGTARGEVEVSVKSKTSITAIRVKFVGMEEVACSSWGTPNTPAWERRKKPDTDSKKQKVFEQSITLFGFADASGRRGGAELEAGTYSYPFEVVLPGNMPPSVYLSTRPTTVETAADGVAKQDSMTASISYTATAYAVIPYGFDAHSTIPFTVASAIPARMVAHQKQNPASFSMTRELLVPDWSGWQACLSRCCGSFKNCVESLTGPYPNIEISVGVWNAAVATETLAATGATTSPRYSGTNDRELVMTEDRRRPDVDDAFSPVSPGDVVVVPNGTVPGRSGITGIPLEDVSALPMAELVPSNPYPISVSEAWDTPSSPPPAQTPAPVRLAGPPAVPSVSAQRPPTATPQYYQTLFTLSPSAAPRRSLLMDLVIKNNTNHTGLGTLHLKLVQVQKVTAGNVTVARVLPMFECSIAVGGQRTSGRVPMLNSKLAAGQTSAKITVEIPLPEVLVETVEEHSALAPPAGTGNGPWFLPTIGTPHINVYTMLTIDAPGLVFSEGTDESRVLIMSNAVKMAAFEDVSNTATGSYTKALILSELALGAEEL